MPARSQTSIEEIVGAGRALVEEGGVAPLTMGAVATSVGVKAPSLYKRVADRAELVRLVAESVTQDLTIVLDEATASGDPATDLRQMLFAARRFADRNPHGFGLVLGVMAEAERPAPELVARASEPVLAATRALAGEERALSAARTVVSWVHGFVSMERAGNFRLGGDVDEAFAYGVDCLVTGLRRSES